jgi:uncharacterized protein (DUF4415 family)
MSRKTVSLTLDTDNPPPLSDAQRAELERLAAQPEAAIDTSDMPPLDNAFWTSAHRFQDRALYRPVKQSTTVRLDADVVAWLKAKGKGYQTRLNAILREAMMREGG